MASCHKVSFRMLTNTLAVLGSIHSSFDNEATHVILQQELDDIQILDEI